MPSYYTISIHKRILFLLKYAAKEDNSMFSKDFQTIFNRAGSNISQAIARLKNVNELKPESYVITEKVGRQVKVTLTQRGDQYSDKILKEVKEFLGWVEGLQNGSKTLKYNNNQIIEILESIRPSIEDELNSLSGYIEKARIKDLVNKIMEIFRSNFENYIK